MKRKNMPGRKLIRQMRAKGIGVYLSLGEPCMNFGYSDPLYVTNIIAQVREAMSVKSKKYRGQR